MISTIIFVIALMITGAWIFKTRAQAYPSANPHMVGTTFSPAFLIKPVLFLFIGILIALIQPYKLQRVYNGNVGFKMNLVGSSRGLSDYSYETGWAGVNSWTEELQQLATWQQHVEYSQLEVIAKGGYVLPIKPSFNYSVIPTSAGDMYVNLRLPLKELESGWLKTAVYGSINDVANKWSVDSIFNKREQFELEILSECNKRTSQWFTMSQLRTNIIPPDALKTSIEAKTKAIQDVQVAESQKLVADARKLEKIAIAQGDSAQAVIEASGRAEAIRKEQISLTPLYIEYIKVNKWDGVNSTTVLGNNSSTLINVK